jgi:hypothetical protein
MCLLYELGIWGAQWFVVASKKPEGEAGSGEQA